MAGRMKDGETARKGRRAARLITAALLALFAAWLIWGNTALMISRVTVKDEGIPAAFDGLRIAQVSDLHNAEFGEGNARLLDTLRNAAPDIIVITGDLVDANRADIPLALDALLSKVDCLTNLTDNTVVSALALVLDKANAAGKPVFGSEIEQVKLGCVAAEGLDYIALGRQTGLMAAKVLRGEAKASEIPYEIITEPGLYVNTEALAKFGIVLSDELKARANEVE